MAESIRSYRDLTTWQAARSLCLVVYAGTNSFPSHEQFGLTSQMRRAAVSVPSNIAEGFGRQTAKEKHQFYHHALGSLFELETQTDLAHAFNYLNQEQFNKLDAEINQCRRLLLALLSANRAKFPNHKSQFPNLERK
jgi:four helix bundle protein